MEVGQMHGHVASRWKEAQAPARARSAHEEALGWFDKALAITRALADADESNLEARRDLAACLNKVGNQHASLGALERAQEAYVESMALRADLFATDPTQMHRRDLALGRFKLGQNLERLADRTGVDPAERVRLLRASEEQFRESVAGYQALREAGVLAGDSAEIGTSARLLGRVREKLEKAGG
jgi:tetratricopeptide (TPR) repeat protein